MNLLIATFWELVLDVILFWGLSEKEREGINDMLRWKRGELGDDGQTQIDSNQRYLLLGTQQGLFLVHRKRKWKGQLDAWSEDLYQRKGRRTFTRIHTHLLRNSVS